MLLAKNREGWWHMEYSALAAEMMSKTAEMLKISGTKQAQMLLHGEMFILHFIIHQKAEVTPSEISAAMGASSARVAMALKSMEGKGLIERRIDQDDRRRIIVTITEHGRSIIKRHHDVIREKIEKILAELGEQDALEYIRIVGRMIEISKKFGKETNHCIFDKTMT